MKISCHDQIGGTDAVFYASKAFVHLCERGHCDKSAEILDLASDKFIAATEKGDIVGILVYRVIPEFKQITLVLIFVSPDYRGTGIATKLYAKLKQIRAAKNKDHAIMAEAFVSNLKMRAAMKKFGMQKVSENYVDAGAEVVL